MAEWADLGHAQRRRQGVPSSHFEAAGPSAGRQHATSDEQYEAAKAADSTRVAQGDGPIDTPLEAMSPEQHAHAPAGGAERHGAKFNVTAAATVLADPTLGPTTRSARIVPSLGTISGGFQDAIQASEY